MKKFLILSLILLLTNGVHPCSSNDDCTPPEQCVWAARSGKKVCTVPRPITDSWD